MQVDTINKKGVHVVVRYMHNMWNYQATQQISLKTHMEVIHDGVKYLSNICDYQATERGIHERHEKSIHEGVKV